MVAVLRAPGSLRGLSYLWSSDTDAVVGSSDHRWKAEADLEILGTTVVCATAPLGADLVFDLERVGDASLYVGNPADRPTIVDGNTESLGAMLAPPADAIVLEGELILPSVLSTGDDPNFGSKPDLRVFYRLL